MNPEAVSDKKLLWNVRLFGGPVLVDGFGNEIRRFRTQKVRAMLAYLALHLGRYCPREVMYEALWPEEDRQVVANRFRVTLASLRRQLEPEGTPFGAVLDVNEPHMVRLRAETVSCDLAQFETLWRSGRQAEALRLATEPLLPDIYDEWAINIRLHYELLTDDPDSSEDELPAISLPLPGASGWSPSADPDAPLAARTLPLFLTRFFGREQEKARLLDMIRTNRLVTVAGIGGIGKTRLSTETARETAWDCVFVALGNLAGPGLLGEAMLKPLGVVPDESLSIDEQLVRLLDRRREILVIFDSAELVVEEVAALTVLLLEKIPNLRVLATSRRILEIPGESVFSLTPLESPSEATPLDKLLEFASVRLFLDRASSARPDFTLTARNVDAIAEICLRLEGIPLALELAAARITSQTPGQIAHALRQNLTGLKSRQRGLSERHRSLRAVMETSLQPLPQEAKDFFYALAIFPDGWTIEMAQTMTGCKRTEEYLELLVASSLVERHEDEQLGVLRFSFRETIRQFALRGDLDEDGVSEWDAAENLVVNGSFERDRPQPTWLSSTGGLFPLPFIVPFGWQGIGSVNVNTPNYAAFPNGVPEGSNTAVVGDHTRTGRLFQPIAANLTAGMTYTFSAWIGSRANYAGTGCLRLETESGLSLADSGPVRPDEGQFKQVTVRFTAREDTPCLGDGLCVSLELVEGSQANFDCVRLTIAPAEPDSLPPD